MEKITIAVSDGSTVTTSNLETFPMMKQAGSYPAAILCEACMRRGIRQLWFVPAPSFTLDDTLGWDFREDEEDSPPAPWIHAFKRGTNAEVDLVRPTLDRNSPFYGVKDDATLLAALLRFKEVVGVTFHHSASATSRELLIGLHRGHKNNVPLKVCPMPPPALDVRVEEPLEWILPPAVIRVLPAFQYVHAYDKNAAYLGPCSDLPLGAGKFEHVTSATDCYGLPGYFRIIDHVEMTERSAIMPVLPIQRSSQLERWVTTPTLAYLKEVEGRMPQVLDAYVWTDHHQPLQPWYRILRDARKALQANLDLEQCRLALAAVKGCYTSFLAGYVCSTAWDRTGDVLFRPDIRHMVIAKARCTLHRTVRRCQEDGATVLGVSGIDTFYVLSNDPSPTAGKPARLNLGTDQVCYKVKGTWELTPAIREMLEFEGLNMATRLGCFKETY